MRDDAGNGADDLLGARAGSKDGRDTELAQLVELALLEGYLEQCAPDNIERPTTFTSS